MNGAPRNWRCPRTLLVMALVPGLLALGRVVLAEPPTELPAPSRLDGKRDEPTAPKNDEKPAARVVSPPGPPPLVLDLTAARMMALQKQPAIAAARASLEAALARKMAVDNLRVPTFLQRDLPIRRQQASFGPIAAKAAVTLAEMNTVYAVQYCYISYLYARTQLRLAENGLKSLESLDEIVGATVKASRDPKERFRTDLTEADRDRIRGMMQLARGRREEAATGAQRALAALREAMAIDHCHFVLAHDRLLDLDVHVDCKKILELALTHRPEIIQTAVAVQVSELEVQAQASRRRAFSVRTFASGSDLHVQPLPSGSHEGGDYRPGAVGPEMPVSLSGQQCDRVNVAGVYQGRAQTVVEKTRNLVRLDVEQTLLRLQEARAKLKEYEQGANQSARTLAKLRNAIDDLGPGVRARIDAILNLALVGSQLRISANEARYQLLIALAGLERGTAGTFCPGLERALQVIEPETSKEGDPKDEKKEDDKEEKNARDR